MRRRVARHVSVTRSDAEFVELSARGVDKGHAVRLFARSLGIRPRHVLAIGDGPNDVTLLRWAGYGVAVGNAPRAVQDQATHVAPPNHEDGVAAVLEELLRGGPAALRAFETGRQRAS